MDRWWKMFLGWSIWGISFHKSVWKLPAHFIDQWPSQCWSLSYYHFKLKLNEVLRSQKLQKSLVEGQLWSTSDCHSTEVGFAWAPDSLLSWWKSLLWLRDGVLQLPQMVLPQGYQCLHPQPTVLSYPLNTLSFIYFLSKLFIWLSRVLVAACGI